MHDAWPKNKPWLARLSKLRHQLAFAQEASAEIVTRKRLLDNVAIQLNQVKPTSS